ncbi:type II toxin-antitoxin system RelE/ParE family toxin [Phyllobacterium sp. K27]
MPQVIFTAAALRDLERLRQFLKVKNPTAAKKAADTIIQTIELLKQYPQAGRPVADMEHHYREVLIDFGNSGYVALYRYEPDKVVILAIRHGREAGY